MEFEKGSGNVFRDLGFPDADIHLFKSDVVTRIDITLRRHQWTEKEAAEMLGISETKLSRILRGDFRDCSVEGLLFLLAVFGQEAELRKDVTSVIRVPKSQHPTKRWEAHEKKEKSESSIKKLRNLPKTTLEEVSGEYRQVLYNKRVHYSKYNKNIKMDMVIGCIDPVASRSSDNIRNSHFSGEPSTWINPLSASVRFTSVRSVPFHPLPVHSILRHIQTIGNFGNSPD